MADPITHAGLTAIGLKLSCVIAGFWGGVLSLSFVKPLTTWQAVLAVLTGTATGGYGTPIIVYYIFNSRLEPTIENGAAFLVGLTAMNIIPGIVRLSEIFKNNPSQFGRSE